MSLSTPAILSSRISLAPHNLSANDLANDLYSSLTTRKIHDPLLYVGHHKLPRTNIRIIAAIVIGLWSVLALVVMAVYSVVTK